MKFTHRYHSSLVAEMFEKIPEQNWRGKQHDEALDRAEQTAVSLGCSAFWNYHRAYHREHPTELCKKRDADNHVEDAPACNGHV